MPIYRVRNIYGERTLHEFKGGLYDKKVSLADLPETVWIAFLGIRPKQWRLDSMKRSPAILKLPNSAEIHLTEASARAAMVAKIKREIESKENLIQSATRSKQSLEKMLLAVNMGARM